MVTAIQYARMLKKNLPAIKGATAIVGAKQFKHSQYKPPVKYQRNDIDGGVTTQKDSKTLFIKRKPNRRIQKKKKRLRRLDKQLKSISNPIHTLWDDAVTVNVDPDFLTNQKWYPFGLMTRDDIVRVENHANAVMTPQGDPTLLNTASVQYPAGAAKFNQAQPYMVSQTWEMSCSFPGSALVSNIPNIVDIYYFKCFRNVFVDQYASLVDLVESNMSGNDLGYIQGATAAPIGDPPADYRIYPSASPFEHRAITKYFKCYKKKQIVLTQGQAFTLNGQYHVKRRIPKYAMQEVLAYKGFTEIILMSVRDAAYTQQGDATNLGQIKVTMTKVNRFKQGYQQTPTLTKPHV